MAVSPLTRRFKPIDPAVIHINKVWRKTMSDQPAAYGKPPTLYVEKWARFILVDGKWDVQMWPDRVTVSGTLFKLRIPVPAELIGKTVELPQVYP